MNYLGKCEKLAEYRGAAKAAIVMFVVSMACVIAIIYKYNTLLVMVKKEAQSTALSAAESKYKGELEKCKGFVKLVSGSDYDDVVRMQADADRIQGVSESE